jgi:hypothetical protein
VVLNLGADHDFDQIWCVWDGGDNHPNEAEHLDTAHRNQINIARSVPSFEVWQLLHIEDLTARPISCDQVKRQVRQNYVPGYGSSVNIFPYSLLTNKHQIAIERAKILEGHHSGHGGEANPSSSVWKLVEQILLAGASNRLG